MADFILGQSIDTTNSQIQVDVDPARPLTKGVHVFQLIVEDDDGLQSDPVQFQVVVEDDRKPTAVLNAPSSVPLGASFRLDGSRSTDAPPGKIVKYTWTLLR